MHGVLIQILAAHRLESAGTDVQGQCGAENSARRECREQRFVEVQAGRGRRHRAGHAREQALVTLAIAGVRRARDVGRQRHAAMPFEELQRRLGQQHLPQVGMPGLQPHRTTGADELLAHPQPVAAARLHQGSVAGQRPLQQQLRAPAGCAVRREPGRHHASVVEHQQVAGMEQRGQPGEIPVFAAAGRAIEQQQPASRTLCQRRLRDQPRGQ